MLINIIKKALFSAAVILLLLSTWFSFEFYITPKCSPKTQFVNIESGTSVKQIAQILQEQGVISKKRAFLLGYQIFFFTKSLKAGEYAFQLPLSTKKVLSTLTEGKTFLHSITFPEGLTRKEIAFHLQSLLFIDEEDFLKTSADTEPIILLDKKALSLEGYLFPETYHFSKGTQAKDVVSVMVSQFKQVFSEKWQRRAEEIGLTTREVVILASLIEKETSLPEEKELVSAVFHNRLKINMKLDCDPTIIYALKQEGRYDGRLRTKDLKYDSPYNTYIYPGLPPGPIANPGKDSLKAALYPADEKFLYFVSKNDGSHHFSLTFREHQNAVHKYQKRKR